MAVLAQFTEQIVALVTPDQRRRLEERAEAQKISLAAVIRDVVDIALPPPTPRGKR